MDRLRRNYQNNYIVELKRNLSNAKKDMMQAMERFKKIEPEFEKIEEEYFNTRYDHKQNINDNR